MLEDIKLLLDIKHNDSDEVLELMLRDATLTVLNYCHIEALPAALEQVVRQLVVATFNYQNESNISAIKRGDTQITYSQPISINDFTPLQKQSLNAFRRWRAK